MKKKLFVIITSRSSYSKFKPIIIELKKKKIDFDIICSSSSVLGKYGDLDKQIIKDGFKISDKIYNNIEHESLANTSKSVGIAIIEFTNLFQRKNPKMILVMGDRYEVIAPSIAASYQNILVAHVQGGEVSGNIDDKVRDALSCLADYHFPATLKSSKRLKTFVKKPENVFHTGCPSIDIAKKIKKNKKISFNFHKIYNGVGPKIDFQKKYLIVMQHPVTDEYGSSGDQILKTYKAVIKSGYQAIWFWPNSDAGSYEISKKLRIKRETDHSKKKKIFFIKNMSPNHFLELVKFSNGIIGNSSSAIRECSYLGVRAINIGSRQKGREIGKNVLNTDYDENKILTLINNNFKKKDQEKFSSSLYGSGRAGYKISKIIFEILQK